jgi:hypothetical protein
MKNITHLESLQSSLQVESAAETFQLLYEFNEFEMGKQIKRFGLDQVLADINAIDQVMGELDIDRILEEGFALSMAITDQLEVVPVKEVRFIYAGYITDARAMGEDFFVINMGNLCRKTSDPEQIQKRLLGLIAHESVHIILRALQIRPPESEFYFPDLVHKCWEEGLTTYIEPSHLPWHEEFKADWDFWMKILQNWVNANHDERIQLIHQTFANPTFKKYHERFIEEYEEQIRNGDDLEEILFDIYFKANGPGYHLGCRLWEIQTEQGNLVDLVKEGHHQAYNWMNIDEE